MSNCRQRLVQPRLIHLTINTAWNVFCVGKIHTHKHLLLHSCQALREDWLKGTPAEHVAVNLFVKQMNGYMCPNSFNVLICAQCDSAQTISINRCSLPRKPPRCSRPRQLYSSRCFKWYIHPRRARRGTESTASCTSTGYCRFAFEQFAFEQTMTVVGSQRPRGKIQGQGNMDVSVYLLQAREQRFPWEAAGAIVIRRWSTCVAFILWVQIAAQVEMKRGSRCWLEAPVWKRGFRTTITPWSP